MAKNRVAYGMVVIIFLMFIFLNEHRMTYVALYAVLILPLLSLSLTLIFKRRFTIREALSAEYITKGETAQFKFTVKNNSFLPCTCVQVCFEANIPGRYTYSEEKYFSVPPRKSHEIIFNISPKYRGNHDVGVKNVFLYDFLGLFKFKQKHGEKLVFVVTPQIHNIPYLPLESVLQGGVSGRTFRHEEDYSIIADYRKYQSTDGYKKIHWKLSAKKNELISKDFQETEKHAALLLIDNSNIALQRQQALEFEDAMVEALVSTLAYCNRLGHPVSFHCTGGDATEFSTDFQHLYKLASGIEFGDFEKFDNFLHKYTKSYSTPMNIIIFIQNINESIFSDLKLLSLLNNNVIVFYFNDIGNNNKIEQLRELNVHCVDFHEIQNS